MSPLNDAHMLPFWAAHKKAPVDVLLQVAPGTPMASVADYMKELPYIRAWGTGESSRFEELLLAVTYDQQGLVETVLAVTRPGSRNRIEHPLPGLELVLGRATFWDVLALPEGELISNKHAEVTKDGVFDEMIVNMAGRPLHYTFANSIVTLNMPAYSQQNWVDATRKKLLVCPEGVQVEWVAISCKPICPRRFPFELFN
jgi:hypothetical protein